MDTLHMIPEGTLVHEEGSPLSSISFADLNRASVERVPHFRKGQPPSSLEFAMMELAGECGEACNSAKKLSRKQQGFVGGTDDEEALVDEVADVVICCDLIAQKVGFDLGAAVARKFNRTSRKYDLPVFMVFDHLGDPVWAPLRKRRREANAKFAAAMTGFCFGIAAGAVLFIVGCLMLGPPAFAS